MTNINELLALFIEYKTEYTSIDSCIKWAENQLEADENIDDPDIILLAGAKTSMEANDFIKKILEHYMGNYVTKDRFCFGKYLVRIYDRYKNDEYTPERIEEILRNIEIKFDYSFEMGYLYNFSDLIWMNGKEPFEKEFEYIAELWRSVNSLDEFNQKYDEKISKSHVVR